MCYNGPVKQQTVNLTSKNISEFGEEDTIYISKNKSGFRFTYLCKFVSFKKGVVMGVVVETDRDYNTGEVGTTLSARLDKCYLWGRSEGMGEWDRCHWFGKGGAVK